MPGAELLFARIKKHLQCRGVTVEEALFIEQHYGVAGKFEECTELRLFFSHFSLLVLKCACQDAHDNKVCGQTLLNTVFPVL